jgi:ketosteroid isomerase-like protein
MSQENVEFVRRGYEALNRGDESVWELIPADFVMDSSRRLIDPGVQIGRDEVRVYWDRLREAWDETYRYEPEELIDAGDKVVAFVQVSGGGKASGAQVEAPVAHVWTFRDGKPATLEYFGEDRAAALEAAGLPE